MPYQTFCSLPPPSISKKLPPVVNVIRNIYDFYYIMKTANTQIHLHARNMVCQPAVAIYHPHSHILIHARKCNQYAVCTYYRYKYSLQVAYGWARERSRGVS